MWAPMARLHTHTRPGDKHGNQKEEFINARTSIFQWPPKSMIPSLAVHSYYKSISLWWIRNLKTKRKQNAHLSDTLEKQRTKTRGMGVMAWTAQGRQPEGRRLLEGKPSTFLPTDSASDLSMEHVISPFRAPRIYRWPECSQMNAFLCIERILTENERLPHVYQYGWSPVAWNAGEGSGPG